VLVTMSVVGRVDLVPADPLDACAAGAFDDHQRRTAGGRRLLGPDAVRFAVESYAGRGAVVLVRDSPWRLGPLQAGLTDQWFTGWVGAACEQRPRLAAAAGPYLARRRAQAAAGRLRATVHHQDLLVLPR
jgi:hypothetical protein